MRRRLYSGVISDVLDTLGDWDHALAPHVRPLDEELVLFGRADKIFFGSDYPFSRPNEGVAMTRAVLEVTKGTNLPPVSSEVVEQIIHSNPFSHWWQGGLALPKPLLKG